MNHLVPILPEAQLAPLRAAYGAAAVARRRWSYFFALLVLLATWLSVTGAEIDPATWWSKLGNFSSYFDRLLTLDTGARVWTDPAEWFWGVRRWLRLLGETLLIAYIGTLTGTVLAFGACFLASRNMMRNGFWRGLARRTLEICRTVPEIVYALIFVAAFGLGAFPGILAIAIHTAGGLGKLFAEVVENIDMRPVEGVGATGGGWFARVRFGAVPQVLSNFASYSLLRFEINVRGAAVLGFVGAGGIGEDLIVAIRKFFYADVSAMLLLVALTVMVIDALSTRLRHHLLRLGRAV